MNSGLIDTVKFRSRVGLDQRDVARLVSRGFSHRKNFTVHSPGEDFQTFVVRDFLHDEATGMRVWGDADSTCVEASVPRVLGLSNDRQADVTEAAAQDAFDRMTLQLCPFTSDGSPWGVTRLDLARNFSAPVALVVGAYSQASHREMRCVPKVFWGQSVSWFGSKRQIVIYDKGGEMGGEYGSLGRVESRWLGTRGLASFAAPEVAGDVSTEGWSWSRPTGPALPIWMQFGKSWRVVHTPLSWEAYDVRLRADLAGFGPQKPVECFPSVRSIGLDALLRFPDIYGSHLDTLSKRTQRKLRADLKAYRCSLVDVDLVGLLWGSAAAA